MSESSPQVADLMKILMEISKLAEQWEAATPGATMKVNYAGAQLRRVLGS